MKWAALLAALLIGVGAFLYWKNLGAEHQLAGAVQQAGTATVAASQAQATTQALRITVAGEARSQAIEATHAQNEQALLATPSPVVPDDLLRVARSGLCHYRAYSDDPGCVGLREADPKHLQDAGAANTPDP